MKLIKKIILPAGLIAVLTVSLPAKKVVDKTVAIVNGKAIMLSEFEKTFDSFFENYKKYAPPQEQAPDKIKDIKKKVLNQMVDDELLKQEAKKRKISITKREVEKGVDQVKLRFQTEREFEEELKKESLSRKEFENRIEEQLMVMKMIEQYMMSSVKMPASDESKALFEKIQKKMNGDNLGLPEKEEKEMESIAGFFKKVSSEKIRARHILIAVKDGSSMKEKSAALKKAKEVLKEIKGGASFSALAMQYSDDPGSKDKGGDLGLFVRGEMVPEFEKTAFKLDVGEVSDPVETDFGYHIIKVEEKHAKQNLAFDNEVENYLLNILQTKARQNEYENWLSKLREKSNIEVNETE